MSDPAGPTRELTLAYDGTDFHGWQVQPDCRTVEGCLREALERLLGVPPLLHGASRTDQGVHALGQAVSLHGEGRIPTPRLVPALNGSLPPDVRVVGARDREGPFHARFSAVGKHYRYTLDTAAVPNVLLRRYAHHVPVALELERMVEAGKGFLGERDFAAYQCESGQPRESTVRTIFDVQVSRRQTVLTVDVWGNGFLYKMVRTMVGTLVEIGRGRWPPDHVAATLLARSRHLAGPTLPPQGLCLMGVFFDPEELEASHRVATAGEGLG